MTDSDRKRDLLRRAVERGQVAPEHHAAIEALRERTRGGSKYGNRRCKDAEGWTYASQLERRLTLALQRDPDVRFLVRQPSFALAPGERIRPDAMLIHDVLPGGRAVVSFVEIKGCDTPTGRRKRDRFEALTGIKIRLLRR